MNSGRSKVGPVRKIAAIVVAAAFVVSLAACSDLPAQVQGCTPNSTAGSASKSISAAGDFGLNPKTHVPTPTVTKKVQTSIIKKGTGMKLGDGDVALVQWTLYFGSNGQIVSSSPTGQNATSVSTDYSKTTVSEVSVGQKTNPYGRYISCQQVGTRSTTVLTASQYLGGAAQAKAAGVDPSLALVMVEDITKGFRGRATGVLQPPQAGFPSVVTAPDGTPGITLDLQSPPKTLQWEVVRRGSGEKIKAGNQVLLQVEGIEWSNPAPTTTFDSTWTKDAPRAYPLTALQSDDGTNSLDPGSVKALVGQTVGSQVLVVVPAKFGYPSGKAPSGYPTGSTLIYVYDVLGVLAK